MGNEEERKNDGLALSAGARELAPSFSGQKLVADFAMVDGKIRKLRVVSATHQHTDQLRQGRRGQGKTSVFVVASTNRVTRTERGPEVSEPDPTSTEIRQLLGHKNWSAAKIAHKISLQIGKLAAEMWQLSDMPGRRGRTLRNLVASQVKTMQALQGFVQRNARLLEQDEINIDGPKFQFALAKFRADVGSAIRKGLGKDSEGKVREILERLEKMWEENREQLRRTLNSMGEDSELPPDPEVNSANT